MIRTKDLAEFLTKFMETSEWKYSSVEFREHIIEIVARLKSYDKLKEGIEKLIETKLT